MSMMMNVIGASHDIDEDTLRKLRGKCVKDVKSLYWKNITRKCCEISKYTLIIQL